ncbi:MAG TPA: phosphopyruvate hydratase [Candidatus Bipolaricaulota bacterium]|nr:phosphopyruvate hydratase [Candidatus Bipolaricaulota bacterium]
MKIKQIKAREILDSRGNPTVEATVTLANNVSATASVPSGASTGVHEALELRDGGKRYGGRGVLRAVGNIEKVIAPKLRNINVVDQKKIDRLMIQLDGTQNKKRLGANAILGVSLACARAAAKAQKKPLYKYLNQTFKFGKITKMPYPTMNILNGGKHADNGLAIQEFMIIPKMKKFSERVRCGVEIFHALKSILKDRDLISLVGDEGGFAPRVKNNEEAIKLIVAAVKKAGYKLGGNVKLGMDLAASEFYANKKYLLEGKPISAEAMMNVLERWLAKYPFELIEDPLAEDDWENWTEITRRLGKKASLVGDDFFVTNIKRLKKGMENSAANAILIKLNQIGSLSETMETIKLAQKSDYKVIVSHRSGETTDDFIADLSVAVGSDYIKTGSLSRGERVCKYNRLMEIETELKF